LLYMEKKGNPQVFEKFICSGNVLYEFVPPQKLIRVHELPQPKAGQQAIEDNFLTFLFGLKPEEAKRRYELKLKKEDQWYIYIEILPKLPGDKADFQRARLVLNSQTFLPRELWFEHPNGNEVKWDIPRIENGVRLDRKDFAAPSAPPGWNMVKQQPPPANQVP